MVLEDKVTRTVDGIFDLEIERGYFYKQKRTAEGKLRGIKDEEFHYSSFVVCRVRSEDIRGVRLEIETQRGSGTIEFPREIALVDRQAMLNQDIRYTKESRSSNTEGTGTDYTLEILSGPLSGQILTKSVMA